MIIVKVRDKILGNFDELLDSLEIVQYYLDSGAADEIIFEIDKSHYREEYREFFLNITGYNISNARDDIVEEFEGEYGLNNTIIIFGYNNPAFPTIFDALGAINEIFIYGLFDCVHLYKDCVINIGSTQVDIPEYRRKEEGCYI